jgi:hypothetical protein
VIGGERVGAEATDTLFHILMQSAAKRETKQ